MLNDLKFWELHFLTYIYWSPKFAAGLNVLFRPFLANFLPTAWISTTKLKFKWSFWGAERVYIYWSVQKNITHMQKKYLKTARNGRKTAVTNFGDQSLLCYFIKSYKTIARLNHRLRNLLTQVLIHTRRTFILFLFAFIFENFNAYKL